MKSLKETLITKKKNIQKIQIIKTVIQLTMKLIDKRKLKNKNKNLKYLKGKRRLLNLKIF